MQHRLLRTTVVGSCPFPGWLEFAAAHLGEFGPDDVAEMQDDAVRCAIHDQLAAGLDVITDGEQTRLDFNLSFYGYVEGIELEGAPARRFGPPAHDQRGRHRIVGELRAPRGLGAVEEYERLVRLAAGFVRAAPPLTKGGPGGVPEAHPAASSLDPLDPSAPAGGPARQAGPTLKASVPGPYTLSGRLIPNKQYPDRWAIAEALLPIVQDELVRLVEAGCRELTVDEPSMSCYAHREDPRRFVEIFNRTVEPVAGHRRGTGHQRGAGHRRDAGATGTVTGSGSGGGGVRLSTHLCFGNYKGRAVGPRRYAPMFPAFLEMNVDEIHVEMASREFAELELIGEVARTKDVAVGVIDVKSYYIETPADVAERVRRCLQFAPAERLSFAPDCGLSQTARWAARRKLVNMVEGVGIVRRELGL